MKKLKINKLAKEESAQATKRERKAKVVTPIPDDIPFETLPARCKHCGDNHDVSTCKAKVQADQELSKEVERRMTDEGYNKLPGAAEDRRTSEAAAAKRKDTQPEMKKYTILDPTGKPAVVVNTNIHIGDPKDIPTASTYTIGQTLIARWDDLEGRHHAPSKVEVNSIQYACHVVKPEGDKGKGKKVWAWEGHLRVMLYRIANPAEEVTLEWANDKLIGPRQTEYCFRLPNEKESSSVERVIVQEMARQAKLEREEKAKPVRKPSQAFLEAGRARRSNGSLAGVIRLLVKDNPHSLTTKAGELFQAFKNGMTVAAYVEAAQKATGLDAGRCKGFIGLEVGRKYIALDKESK